VLVRVVRSATTNSNMARKVATAGKRGAESSGDEGDKNAKESQIVLVEFNKSLREANSRKQGDLKGVTDLTAYLHDMGVDTSGSGGGKNEWFD